MEQAGLIRAEVIRAYGGVPVRAFAGPLTWEGEDFYASISRKTVWERVKQILARNSNLPFELVKAVALKAATEMLA